MNRPYLTAYQVAELLQLNVETIYALIAREGLPAARVGRRWRFDESRVRRWFRRRCNQTEAAGDHPGGIRPCPVTHGQDQGTRSPAPYFVGGCANDLAQTHRRE